MADLSDVETGLVNLISAAIYPTGTSGASAIGAPARVYRGWPNAAALDADLLAGTVNVTVFADPGMSRNTTRYWPTTLQTSTVAPTITATVSGAAVTLAGTITAGNVAGIQAGSPLAAYATIVLAGDTLTAIAARLAVKIAGASAAGAAITMPGRLNLSAATMAPQAVATEVRRQDQGFRVSCWCANPGQRDITAGLIDNAIAAMRDLNGNFTRFMPTRAGETGFVRYLRTYVDDKPTKAGVWRRDLLYQIQYASTLLEQNPMMLFGGGTLSAGIPTVATSQIGALPPA